MNSFVYRFFCTLLFSCSFYAVSAQASFQSDKELKKVGDNFFNEGKYTEAYTYYSQLVIRNPRNLEYNYLFGVCAIYAAADKEQAVPYLELAANSSEVNKDALFYLGRAYMLTYRFEEAIAKFEQFKKVASPKILPKFDVDTYIQMCRNGSRLIRNISDWVVVDKKELEHKNFFLAYEVPSDEGKFLIKPNDETFTTPLDIKNKETSVIFLAKASEQIFFSSYGNDGKRGKDIYKIVKLPNGEWSKPQALPNPINTDKDEDYPFLHPDGKTLYFSSKGHNSMGGYDIFKSIYNEENETWSVPVNLGFPINSPDDDVLYIEDKSGSTAFFSSARTSAHGKYTVYKINIEQKPADWALVRGRVIPNRDEQELSTRITVKDMQDNSLIGIYNSNEKTGKYFLALPNGSACLFTVENADFKTQSQTIQVPLKYELNPMRQELKYELNSGKLIIKTMADASDQEEEEPLPFIVKQKAKLNITPKDVPKVMAKDIPTEEVEEENDDDGDYTLSDTRLNNLDIIRIAYEDAKELDREAEELKEQASKALILANKKNEIALNKRKEAQQLQDEADKFSGDASQKQVLLDKAKAAKEEADLLKQDALAAYSVAKKIENAAKSKKQEADLALDYAKALDDASKSKNSPELIAKLSAMEKQMEDLSKSKSDTLSILDGYKLVIENKQKELEKTKSTRGLIVKEVEQSSVLISKSQQEADNTKNKALKEGLLNEIESLKQDNLDRESELKKYDAKLKRLEDEYNLLAKEATLAGNITSGKVDDPQLPLAISSSNQPPVAKVVIPTSKPIITTSNTTPPPEEIDDEEILQEINSFNAEELEAAEKIVNKIDKETRKLKIFTSWANDLDVYIKEEKQNLAKETNVNKKSTISSLINEATTISVEKKSLANQTKSKIDSLKQLSQPLVAKTTTVSIPTTSPLSSSPDDKLILPASSDTAIVLKKEPPPLAPLIITTKESIVSDTTTLVSVLPATPTITEVSEKKDTSFMPLSTAKKEIETSVVTSVVSSEKKEFESAEKVRADSEIALDEINRDNEENLKTAEQLELELDREVAKANVLNIWSGDLEKFIKAKKQELALTTDGVQKEKYNDIIKKAGLLSREKRSLANNALIRVEELRESIAINDKTKETIKKVSGKDIYMQFLSINKKNNAALDSTVKIKVDLDRELTQSEVYENWAEELALFVDEQRKVLNNENDLNEKAYKEKTINEAIVVINQKKSLATKASLRAELISRSPETAAVLLSPPPAQIASAVNVDSVVASVKMEKPLVLSAIKEKTLEGELAEAEKIADTYEREKTKEDIYKRMAKRADNEVESLKKLLLAEQSDIQKKNITTQITEQQKNSKEYAELAKKSLISAEYYLQTKGKAADEMEEIVLTPAAKPTPSLLKEEKIVVQKKPASAPLLNPAVKQEGSASHDDELHQIYNRFTRLKDDIKLSKDEKFDVKPQAAYSAESPIPVGKIPAKGLIYMIQVGSFKNSIPQNTFGGIKPITAEKTEIGYMRYFAGEFSQFSSASLVKTQIRSMGFKDAFVVAFYNGKRITLNEASVIESPTAESALVNTNQPLSASSKLTEKKNEIVISTVGAAIQEIQQKQIVQQKPNASKANLTDTLLVRAEKTIESTSIPPPKGNQKEERPASKPLLPNIKMSNSQQETKSIEISDGNLFYTVQVGVFSQEVSPETFYNAKPLFFEIIEGGKMRYNVGFFDNILSASEAKKAINNAGVPNAFVTAMYNNKRIAVADAKQIVEEGKAIFPSFPLLNKLPFLNGDIQYPMISSVGGDVHSTPSAYNVKEASTPKTNSSIETPKPILSLTYAPTITPAQSQSSPKPVLQEDIVFKVQIGAYREQVPIEQANLFVKLADKDFQFYKDKNGVTIYTAGNFKTYEEAAKLKAELIDNIGVKDAFVVAYKEGQKIPLSEVIR